MAKSRNSASSATNLSKRDPNIQPFKNGNPLLKEEKSKRIMEVQAEFAKSKNSALDVT